MTPRYSVTARCGQTVMRRDFATETAATAWRILIEAQGWTTDDPVPLDDTDATPAPVVPLWRAI